MSSSRDHAPPITAVTSGQTHTPGPWHQGDSLDVWQSGGGIVAQCFWVSGAISVEQAGANARLMAAAPDLLIVALHVETLCAAMWEDQRTAHYWPELRALLEASKAAIARAEGTGPLEGRTGQLREDK